jgi:hypothetical protein
MIKPLGVAGALAVTCLLSAGSANAITHTNDYKTNIQNYRYCDAAPLTSCRYEHVISPSAYYLEDGRTITLIYTNTGDVQLKIDANTVKLDTDASFACSNQQYQCSAAAPASGTCLAPSPKNTTACTANKCNGGTNDGGPCSSSSACPFGACTRTDTCIFAACQAGPQSGKYCGGGTGSVSCTSTNNQSGYKIRIFGNETGGEIAGGFIYYLLRGDDVTDEGCKVECPVTLGNDGSVNQTLTGCSQSGECLNSPLESIHSVQLVDPDGQILGIPGIGTTKIFYSAQQADPARAGDCVRVPTNGPCP